MDRLPTEHRYSEVMWNCPLSEACAEDLLSRLELSPDTDLVDIGCGWGELLLRASEKYGTRARGIDVDVGHIERGRTNASDRNLDVEFIQKPADQWCRVDREHEYQLQRRGVEEPREERAICIGASHIFGGTREMLFELSGVVPKGMVLVGDMCWERPPSPACRDLFGDDILSLRDFAASCGQMGWDIMHLVTATQQDWDTFESGLWAGPRRWLRESPDNSIVEAVEHDLKIKEENYFNVYRGQLSFVYAILEK